jgi:hypothetical protein
MAAFNGRRFFMTASIPNSLQISSRETIVRAYAGSDNFDPHNFDPAIWIFAIFLPQAGP